MKIPRMFAIVFCTGFVLAMACAALPFIRPVVRGLNDIARALCEQTVAESDKAALGGMKAADWCAIQSNLDPFIRALTVAQKDAMQKTGLKREEVKP